MIVFGRWVRAKWAIRHLGPVDFTLRPAGETMLYLIALIVVYLGMVPVAVAEEGWFGMLVGAAILAFEVRALLYQRDERIELRARDLVVHHHGRIEVFDRDDVVAIDVEDYVRRAPVTSGGLGFGRPVSVLYLTDLDGERREIWQCPSSSDRQQALRSALAIFHRWMDRFARTGVDGGGAVAP